MTPEQIAAIDRRLREPHITALGMWDLAADLLLEVKGLSRELAALRLGHDALLRAHDSHAAEAGRLRGELAGASRLPRSAEEASP